MSFNDKLSTIVKNNNSLVCVGLDSDFEKLPLHLKQQEYPQFVFNKAIIDGTYDLVCTYKLNTAFYEARGEQGIKELKMTCDYLTETYKEIPIILDAKRADIGNTNHGYIAFAYDYLKTDAITLHPYLGSEALKPFLESKEQGAIILCRNSNPGAGELQDLILSSSANPQPLYKIVAKKVAHEWNENKNCLLVVAATYPEEMAEIRNITGDMTFLVPGIGAQGGSVEKTVKAGLNSQNAGLIIHSARSIIFASRDQNFAEKAKEEAKKLRNEINKYRS